MTFFVESIARDAPGQVLGPFLGQKIEKCQRYSHIPPFYGLLLKIKISSPYPQLSLDNFGLLARLRLAPRQVFFGPDCPKLYFWTQKHILLVQKWA